MLFKLVGKKNQLYVLLTLANVKFQQLALSFGCQKVHTTSLHWLSNF